MFPKPHAAHRNPKRTCDSPTPARRLSNQRFSLVVADSLKIDLRFFREHAEGYLIHL